MSQQPGEKTELQPSEQLEARRLAEGMPSPVREEVVRNPQGLVASAVLSGGGTMQGMLQELSKAGSKADIPPAIQTLVTAYVAQQDARREADNDSAMRTVAGVTGAAFGLESLSRNNAYAAEGRQRAAEAERGTPEYLGRLLQRAATLDGWLGMSQEERLDLLGSKEQEALKKLGIVNGQLQDNQQEMLTKLQAEMNPQEAAQVHEKAMQLAANQNLTPEEYEQQLQGFPPAIQANIRLQTKLLQDRTNLQTATGLYQSATQNTHAGNQVQAYDEKTKADKLIAAVDTSAELTWQRASSPELEQRGVEANINSTAASAEMNRDIQSFSSETHNKLTSSVKADDVAGKTLDQSRGAKARGVSLDDDEGPSPVAAADPRTISNLEKLSAGRMQLEQTASLDDMPSPAMANRPTPRPQAAMS